MNSKAAWISEELCIGCGICVKVISWQALMLPPIQSCPGMARPQKFAEVFPEFWFADLGVEHTNFGDASQEPS